MPYDFSSEEVFIASAPIDEQRKLRDALRSLHEQRLAEVAAAVGAAVADGVLVVQEGAKVVPAPAEVPETPAIEAKVVEVTPTDVTIETVPESVQE